MARKENTTDLKAGLSFGASRNVNAPAGERTGEAAASANEKATPAVAAVQQKAPEEPGVAAGGGTELAATYESMRQKKPESRTVRLQAVITPSLNEKLSKFLAEGKIDSKNDLINFLLERYFDEMK